MFRRATLTFATSILICVGSIGLVEYMRRIEIKQRREGVERSDKQRKEHRIKVGDE